MMVGADISGPVSGTPNQPAVPMAAITERRITSIVARVPTRPRNCSRTATTMTSSARGRRWVMSKREASPKALELFLLITL